MDKVEALLGEYRKQLTLPWQKNLSGPERVWIAVYPPDLERRLRPRIPDFELATKAAGRSWVQRDLTASFADWLNRQEYRESYFAEPDLMKPALDGFARELEDAVRSALAGPDVDDGTVVALIGAGALFPMVRVSTLIQRAASEVRGRLLVFFPGTYESGNYRLLDARDGWNYLAVPITIPQGASR